MIDSEIYRPIRIAGIALLIIGVVGVYIQYDIASDQSWERSFVSFLTIITLWYLITGVGMLTHTKIGYYCLMANVFLLLASIPIGTYFGLKALKHIKENNVKDIFIKKTIEI